MSAPNVTRTALLAALLPALLPALSTAFAISLVRNPDPQIQHSAAWISLSQLVASWIVLVPLHKILNRPGGTWSVSWLAGGAHELREEGGWKDALVHGGLVSIMNYASTRAFVGMDVPSAVGFLSLAIPASFIDIRQSKSLSVPFLLCLAAASIAISLAATTSITSLHNRTYSLTMCLLYLVCSSTYRHSTGTDPTAALVKTMTGKKPAFVALLSTLVLTQVLAVNDMERLLPLRKAVPFLVVSAGMFTAAAAFQSATQGGTGSLLLVWSACTKIASTGFLLVLLTALVPSECGTILIAQAFIFLVAAIALWMSCIDRPSDNSFATSLNAVSRSASSATLTEMNTNQCTDVKSVPVKTASNDDSDIEAGFRGDSKSGRPEPGSQGDRLRLIAVGALLLPVAWWIGRHALVTWSGTIADEAISVKSRGWIREPDYDIVVAYYDEERSTLKETIETVKRKVERHHTTRTIVYAKGPDAHSLERMGDLRREVGADEVVALDNVGREGETYLNHIIRSYDSLSRPLAQQTFFIQPHFAWDWIFSARLENVVSDATGFVSFGPYLNASCTADGSEIDSHGQSHPRIGQIYSSFQGDLCPADGFTITWAGQFMVSRKRILSNKLSTYKNLDEFFHVPKLSEDDPAYGKTRKEWIWKEGWWNSIPSAPTLGHALERSWPAVFHCSDVAMALDCQGAAESDAAHCQCVD